MRWPSPRAQTAQPERWRMRRWSREPRRMSVVEGRGAASLVRASRVLSVRFIYIHETLQGRSVSRVFKHFYEILFFELVPDCRVPPPAGETMTLVYPSRRRPAATPSRSLFLKQRMDSPPSRKIALTT